MMETMSFNEAMPECHARAPITELLIRYTQHTKLLTMASTGVLWQTRMGKCEGRVQGDYRARLLLVFFSGAWMASSHSAAHGYTH